MIFFETLANRLAEPDRAILAERGIPFELIRRGATERPYEAHVETICGSMRQLPWTERQLVPDKGWQAAFEHFGRAFLEHAVPRNADAAAGKQANDLAFALLESKRSGVPVAIS